MKGCLIAYFSRTGNTATMADHIAEDLRIGGHEADVKPVAQIGGRSHVNRMQGRNRAGKTRRTIPCAIIAPI